MKSLITNRIISPIVCLLFVTSIVSVYANGLNTMAAPYPYFQKGMTYVTWSKDAFSTNASNESLKIMKDSGVESVAIIVTYYQEQYNSTEINPTDRTPSDASVRHAIRKAHEYGLKVMLKPHIDLISDDGNTRSDIGFHDDEKWEKWFASYLSFVTHYARMARDEDVEFFCIGTELSFASTRKDFWRESVIKDVRDVFKGQITYAANWDEYKNVEFWDKLDYVGIDAYFPIADKSSATSEELLSGWKNWLSEIEAFQKTVNKPVVFTESGYCSANIAPKKPWEDASRTTPNTELQKECYKALVETFWNKPWFFGVYWWAWNTYPQSGGKNNSSFTPQNKPALEYLKEAYSMPIGMKCSFSMPPMAKIGETDFIDKLNIESVKLSSRTSPGSGSIAFTGEMARKRSFDNQQRKE